MVVSDRLTRSVLNMGDSQMFKFYRPYFLLLALWAGGTALVLFVGKCHGQEPPTPAGKFNNEVDWAEVQRWGDRVTVSGEGPRAGSEVMFSQAMAPPALDDDQWFLTLWGTSTDPITKTWLKAFEVDPYLTPFIAEPPPEAKRKAWAHFNFYKSDDPTQSWRFRDFKIEDASELPIVTVQAPRNGRFGKPTVIIDRINLKQVGGPAGFKKRLSDTVSLWCRKLQQSGYQPPITPAQTFDPNSPAAFFSPGGSRQQNQIGGNSQIGGMQYGPSYGPQANAGFPWGPTSPPANQPISPVFPAGGPAGGDVSNLTETPQFFFHGMLVVASVIIGLFIFQLKPGVAAWFQRKADPEIAQLKALLTQLQTNGGMSSGQTQTATYSPANPPTQPNPPILGAVR